MTESVQNTRIMGDLGQCHPCDNPCEMTGSSRYYRIPAKYVNIPKPYPQRAPYFQPQLSSSATLSLPSQPSSAALLRLACPLRLLLLLLLGSPLSSTSFSSIRPSFHPCCFGPRRRYCSFCPSCSSSRLLHRCPCHCCCCCYLCAFIFIFSFLFCAQISPPQILSRQTLVISPLSKDT